MHSKNPSLYSRFIKETLGKDILETEHGFVTYSFTEDALYIENIYVLPDYRRTREGSKLADQVVEIAQARGVKKLIGSVYPSSHVSTDSLKTLLAYGFKLESATNNFILLSKGIDS